MNRSNSAIMVLLLIRLVSTTKDQATFAINSFINKSLLFSELSFFMLLRIVVTLYGSMSARGQTFSSPLRVKKC